MPSGVNDLSSFTPLGIAREVGAAAARDMTLWQKAAREQKATFNENLTRTCSLTCDQVGDSTKLSDVQFSASIVRIRQASFRSQR